MPLNCTQKDPHSSDHETLPWRQTLRMKLSLAAAAFLVLLAFSLPASAADWPMPGANPARTSWSAEEVPGETVWALLRVLPHLPAELRQRVRTYVQEWRRSSLPSKKAVRWLTAMKARRSS